MNIYYENIIINRISQTICSVRLLSSFWVHCFHYQKLKKILTLKNNCISEDIDRML